MLSVDPEHFRAAAARFAAFFQELTTTFIERQDVLAQFALALLSREHVLLTGPPGTAKSQLAAAVLGRVIDEETGAPSVFARHFTENTVQTDLIGPIDFKTLMETGRTEHFTDEGMLGEVHAFLDEVLDGRDMLLRSTLNLLLERELKQGGRTTRGRIECAFMTSNRYIAEILESSRETLLAFVDRIAFINFVPRGFSDPLNLARVVRRQAGGRGVQPLQAPLSVQDLDVLQSATESVYVGEDVCDAVVSLVDMLDADFAAAARNDPNFSATRYLSTRTAVRAARLLRAVTVYKKVFSEPDRALEAHSGDISMLRLHLLLSGIAPDGAAKRIAKESDPRERRQLEILRTEREIFDRCYKRLPQRAPAPRPAVDVAGLEKKVRTAQSEATQKGLLDAAKELAAAATSGGDGADRAAKLLSDTVGALVSRALRAGMTPGVERGQSAAQLAGALADLADDLEKASPAARPTARWLRGRARLILDETGALARDEAASFELLLRARPSKSELAAQADARLQVAETIFTLRNHLDAEGAEPPARVEASPQESSRPAGERDPWLIALARFTDEQALLWDAVLERHVEEVLGRQDAEGLPKTLAALSPAIEQIHAVAARIQALGGSSSLAERVMGPRMRPLVSAVFTQLASADRRQLVREVEAIRALLDQSRLGGVIRSEDLVAWSADVLLRTARAEPLPEGPPSREAWAGLREKIDPRTVLETLVEIAVAASDNVARTAAQPADAVGEVFRIVRSLPPQVRDRCAAVDLERVERGVDFLEAWWGALARDARDTRNPAKRLLALEAIVRSGFLHVMRTESAPASLALEATSVAEIFPDHSPAAESLRARLEQLDRDSTAHLVALLESRANESWTRTLRGDKGRDAGS